MAPQAGAKRLMQYAGRDVKTAVELRISRGTVAG